MKSRIAQWWEKFQRPAIGAVFFALLGVLSYYTIIAAHAFDQEAAIRLPVRLQTAEGIRDGVPVFMQGVQVGIVGSLHYMTLDGEGRPEAWARADGTELETEGHGQTVVAILYVKKDVLPSQTLEFYPNYRIVTRYKSAISSKVVEIDPGSAVPTFLREYDKRKERVPGSVLGLGIDLSDDFPTAQERALLAARARGDEYLLESFQPLTLTSNEYLHFLDTGALPHSGELVAAANYEDPIYMIASVIQENRANILEITRNLKEISHKINEGDGTVASLLNKQSIYGGANGVLEEAIVLTQEVRDGAEDLRESRAQIDFVILAFGALL